MANNAKTDNQQYVDDKIAAELVERTKKVGDNQRSRIGTDDYQEISNEASEFIEQLAEEAPWFNYASILRTRALNPETSKLDYLTFCNKDKVKGFEVYSYEDANKAVNRTANLFKEMGIKAGDKIAIIGNAPEHVFARNAGLGLGATISPLSIRYNKKELTERLNLIEADMVVVTAPLQNTVLEASKDLKKPIIMAVIERNQMGEKIADKYKVKTKLKKSHKKIKDIIPFISSLEKMPEEDFPILKVDSKTPAFSMMTSGSSGILKEVRIPHSYGLGSYIRGNPWWAVDGKSKVYCTAPPGWMYFYRGLTMAEIAGASFYVNKTKDNRPDIEEMTNLIEENKITVFAGIPSIYSQIIDHIKEGKKPLASVENFISTGEQLHESLSQMLENITGQPIYNGYAATEEGPMIAVFKGMEEFKGSIGVPLPGVELWTKIENHPTKFETEGKFILLVKQSSISSRHRYSPGPSGEEYPDRDIITFVDMEGKVVEFRNMKDFIGVSEFRGGIPVISQITRADQLIKRKAIQIFPSEVIAPLTEQFPYYTRTCAFGIPDKERGNSVVAFLEMIKDDFDKINESEIHKKIDRVLESMSSFKRPDYIFIASVKEAKAENKIMVGNIERILAPLARALLERGERGGCYVLPESEKPIDEWKPIEQQEQIENLIKIEDVEGSVTRITSRTKSELKNPPTKISFEEQMKAEDGLALTEKRIPSVAAILIIDRPDGPTVLVLKRSSKMSAFPDDMMFPRGLVAGDDVQKAINNVIREDLGSSTLDQIKFIGTLPDKRVLPITGYEITTMVGKLPADFDIMSLRHGPEVTSVVEIPLETLLNPENHVMVDRLFTDKGGKKFMYERPSIDLGLERNMSAERIYGSQAIIFLDLIKTISKGQDLENIDIEKTKEVLSNTNGLKELLRSANIKNKSAELG